MPSVFGVKSRVFSAAREELHHLNGAAKSPYTELAGGFQPEATLTEVFGQLCIDAVGSDDYAAAWPRGRGGSEPP